MTGGAQRWGLGSPRDSARNCMHSRGPISSAGHSVVPIRPAGETPTQTGKRPLPVRGRGPPQAGCLPLVSPQWDISWRGRAPLGSTAQGRKLRHRTRLACSGSQPPTVELGIWATCALSPATAHPKATDLRRDHRLWPGGQIQPPGCFYPAGQPRMGFTVVSG